MSLRDAYVYAMRNPPLRATKIEPMDTKLSQETIDALKAIDDNIREAQRRIHSILVGGAVRTKP